LLDRVFKDLEPDLPSRDVRAFTLALCFDYNVADYIDFFLKRSIISFGGTSRRGRFASLTERLPHQNAALLENISSHYR
jgi:hypothetical protein